MKIDHPIMNISFVLAASAVLGCSSNDSCKKDYQGVFKMNIAYITDSSIKNFVLENRWDTVLLISKPDGAFHFRSADIRLKDLEGDWFVESNNIEGDCIGYIKQGNLRKPVPVGPFIISANESGRWFSMQFVKVDSLDVSNY